MLPLAMMDHPNVAKILDGGVTETGRPYFVMDLVQGLPIVQFSDEAKLSTDERLALFLEVCSAIQHAHQKGIIHRDIKPSNILVTLHGDQPVPKVIDFGIAKATQQSLTDKTLFTQFQQFIGTPAYMSPEQATLSGLDIDTRSDIYSLGVLLYELLTGKTPFDANELLKAGLDEMRQTIREKEPERPSTRLADEDRASSRRLLQMKELIHRVRGDLDWIVMKCLEKDRARRYESANGLASDIQRHLNNEPVVARPPSAAYRFQKFVRRKKGVFTGASILLTFLVMSVGISTWEAVKARRAEQEQSRLRRESETARQNEAAQRQQAETDSKKARTEAAKSQQVAQYLKDMLLGVRPSVALGRDTTLLREILDKTAVRVSDELTNQPEVEIEMLGALAITYDSLGLYTKEEEMARQSLEVARSRFGSESAAASEGLYQVGLALSRAGRLNEAEKAARESVTIRRRLLEAELAKLSAPASAKPVNESSLHFADRAELGDLYASLNVLALVLHRQNKLAEAETAYVEALKIARRLRGNEHRYVATFLNGLGLVLREEGKLPEAEMALREALATYRKLSEMAR